MAGSGGGFDWDLDLKPIRPSATSQDSAQTGASAGSHDLPLDLVGALSDLKRSVDRLAVRLGRIERALAEAGVAVDAEPATRRLRTLGPKPVPPPATELPSDGRKRRSVGGH